MHLPDFEQIFYLIIFTSFKDRSRVFNMGHLEKMIKHDRKYDPENSKEECIFENKILQD